MVRGEGGKVGGSCRQRQEWKAKGERKIERHTSPRGIMHRAQSCLIVEIVDPYLKNALRFSAKFAQFVNILGTFT